MIIRLITHLLVVMSIFSSILAHAHDTDKAYFKIQEAAGNIVVFAEFPWSIRKVLDNIKTEDDAKQDLQLKLFEYVKEHLILEKDNGDRLPVINIELFKNTKEGHHSTINYKILFKGNQLYKITNTLMCDYYKDQLNYHVLFDQSDSKITNAENASFVVQVSSSEPFVAYYVGLLLLLVLTVVVYIIRKSNTK